MKTVFSNSETCHIWAHQQQSNGHNANSSIFFENTIIYSYGKHFAMARICEKEGITLITTQSYSVTTSAHLSEVGRAVSHHKVIYVDNVLAGNNEFDNNKTNQFCHKQNIEHLVDQYQQLALKSARARANSDWLLQSAERTRAQAIEYRKVFKVKGVKIPAIENKEALLAKAKVMKAKAAQARKAFKAENLALFTQVLAEWKAGEISTMGRFRTYDNQTYLKLIKKENELMVQSSQNVNCSIKHAKLAYLMVKRCVARKDEWKTNGHSIHLGTFKVDSISATGTLKAGCHTIKLAEIQWLADQLGWDKS